MIMVTIHKPVHWDVRCHAGQQMALGNIIYIASNMMIREYQYQQDDEYQYQQDDTCSV